MAFDTRAARCADAIIVIPGIMGSELADAHSGRVLWGLADAGWYVRAWTTGSSLDSLSVDDDERSGRTARIRPVRLLRFPAFAPVLRGFEPYTRLVSGLRQIVTDPAAVLPFPYDWRLPVAHNADRLATAAHEHLQTWRKNRLASRSARLVLVAHSMGGLVASYFADVLGGNSEIRSVITLGTPFHGSVDAAGILSGERSAPIPLPRRRLRRLAASLPGVHDLLPSYRCVAEGGTARVLTPSDVSAFGGDAGMAVDAFALHARLAAGEVPGLRTVVGVHQPTAQSLVLRGGEVIPQRWAYLPDPETGGIVTEDRAGDGTVYRDVAARSAEPAYFAQAHGSIAASPETVEYVKAVVTERTLGPWLGEPSKLGVDAPDLAVAGRPFQIDVSSTDDPALVSCVVKDAAGARLVAIPALASVDGRLSASVTLPEPGLYRIEAKGQAFSPVTQMVLACAPESQTPGEGRRGPGAL